VVRGRRWAALAAALALLAGACAGDDDAGDGGSADESTVTVVSLNLLHGTACAEDTGRCELPARVALFADQLAEAGCPEVVSLQEANQQTIDELTPLLGDVCDGAYEVVWDDDPTLDREVVLTTEEVLGFARTPLAGPLRTAFWVRARRRRLRQHPLGQQQRRPPVRRADLPATVRAR